MPGLSRRLFFKGLGMCVGLPLMESLLPARLRAATAVPVAGTTPSGAPLRMAFMYFPNGARQDYWWPTGAGTDFELARTMQPLAALKRSIQVVGGLSLHPADPGDDGGGDHARANATFLTGTRARKTEGSDIHVGISVDQVAARRVGPSTRFPSLELSCDSVRKAGGCDSGYSCAYVYNLSWQSPTTPMTPEPNPRLVFERLFGSGSPEERQRNFEQRLRTQKSLLDFVLDDARSLGGQLSRRDQDKLDEYLTSVREIERRITHAESFGPLPSVRTATPDGIPADYGRHMDLMYDLLALAFQTDSTRVATLLLAGDGTNRAFPEINIAEGHHYCSHHRGNVDLLDKVGRIDRFYMDHFARFLTKIETMKDPDGTSVLDNSMIVYGCGNSDGNQHTHTNLPIVLAGKGGGTLAAGRSAHFGGESVTNLHLGLVRRMGVGDVPRVGDSTGELAI
ncbi:MAG TPA: DUF1552 domain-containing protein [Opitutaceae bacterium]